MPSPNFEFNRRLILIFFLIFTLGTTLFILTPFFIAMAWAGILAYVTWPLYKRLNLGMKKHNALAALLMTLITTLILLGPLTWVIASIVDDVATASVKIEYIIYHGLPSLPPKLQDWPGGSWLVAQYTKIQANPEWLQAKIAALGLLDPTIWKSIASGLGHNLTKFILAVFILFFVYRHGETVLNQFGRIASHWLGDAAANYLNAVGITVRAVVFGILFTSLAQGMLASLGYWVAGIKAPALWGALTALISIIPFTGPLVWISLSLSLLIQGKLVAAIGLFLWGALVVSWVDNLVRPIAISGPTQIPFLLVFLAILGGINSFGLIGLFLGPVLLAVSLAIWREWFDHAQQSH